MKKTDPIFNSVVKVLRNIRPSLSGEVDKQTALLDESFFETFDCLSCAACCKSLGPRVTDHDIKNISTYLKVKPSVFFTTYLRTDEDGDYVFKTMPCPFLQKDNFCSIYSVRPRACREYPHTQQSGFLKNMKIHNLNYPICPAVKFVMSALSKKYEK